MSRPALSRGSTAVSAVTAAAFLALAGAATAVVVSQDSAHPTGPRALALAGGSLALSDSLGGGAILTAAGIAPGDAVEGTLTIRNTGSLPGELGLASARVEVSGGHGQDLLAALRLRITDITGGASVPVHDGTLADVDAADLAELAPGADRTYRFVARLPADGERDNRLQGAAVQLAYAWTLTATDPGTGPDDPTPTGPASPPDPGLGVTVAEPPAALPVVPQPGPAPGGSPAPGAPAAPSSPVARMTTRSTRLDARGRFGVRVSCARGPRSCRVRVRVRRGSTTLATRLVTVRPGRAVVLRTRPDAATLRSLRRGSAVVLHVSLRPVGSRRVTSTTRVVVRPARRH